jgi:hypothetical protein
MTAGCECGKYEEYGNFLANGAGETAFSRAVINYAACILDDRAAETFRTSHTFRMQKPIGGGMWEEGANFVAVQGGRSVTDTTATPIVARKPPRTETWLSQAAKCLWPGAHNVGLASLVGRPKTTTKAWIAGTRRAPPGVLRVVEHALRAKAEVALSAAAFLKSEIAAREREPIRRSGWAEVRQRDGLGSLPRDGRWRGGRRGQR